MRDLLGSQLRRRIKIAALSLVTCQDMDWLNATTDVRAEEGSSGAVTRLEIDDRERGSTRRFSVIVRENFYSLGGENRAGRN